MILLGPGSSYVPIWGIQIDPKAKIPTGRPSRHDMDTDEEAIAETRRKYNRINDCRQDPVEGGSQGMTLIPSIWSPFFFTRGHNTPYPPPSVRFLHVR